MYHGFEYRIYLKSTSDFDQIIFDLSESKIPYLFGPYEYYLIIVPQLECDKRLLCSDYYKSTEKKMVQQLYHKYISKT